MTLRNNTGPVKWILIILVTLFLAVFLILPLVYILMTALGKGVEVYKASITDKYAVKAIQLTVQATLWAVAVNTIFGIAAAWCLTKYAFRGKKIISTFIDLPVTVSPIIAGLIYVLTFGRQSFLYPILDSRGIQIIFAVPGIILATIFVTFPFISRELIPVLNAQGTDEEEAAALMGAGTFTIFRRVTFPHIKWALLYGIVLCTARAMGEFGAVSVLSGHLRGKTNTLPLYIELLYQGYDYTGAFAASSILVIMAVLVLILRLFLAKFMNKVCYFGMGPGETYADKHHAGRHGTFKGTAASLHEDYIRPQENGSHFDCDYVTVKGKGLSLTAAAADADPAQTFSFGVSVYTAQELERRRHNYELEPCGSTVLCLDHKMAGIGSASCGPALLPKYSVSDDFFRFSFMLKPEEV